MNRKWEVRVLVGILILSLFCIVAYFFKFDIFSHVSVLSLKYWGGEASRIETIRNITLIVVAPCALWLAYVRTKTSERQREIAEKGQNIDRFQKAVSMLGDSRLSVREAGIFVLNELGKVDKENHYLAVQNTLCSYLRNRSQEEIESYEVQTGRGFNFFEDNDDLPSTSSDIIQALRSFSDLRTKENIAFERTMGWMPDLSGLFLHNYDNPDSARFEFSYASLRGAYFVSARLIGSNFKFAHLVGLNGSLAELDGSNFSRANIVNSKFYSASLLSCDFTDAQILNTDFHITKME